LRSDYFTDFISFRFAPPSYVEHDFSKPDTESQFAIGLTDDYSLDSAISYSLNDGGLGSDQCWRHKSQNRAAMSLLCTVDEGGHMVPGKSIWFDFMRC
jgi:hypothetical protein